MPFAGVEWQPRPPPDGLHHLVGPLVVRVVTCPLDDHGAVQAVLQRHTDAAIGGQRQQTPISSAVRTRSTPFDSLVARATTLCWPVGLDGPIETRCALDASPDVAKQSEGHGSAFVPTQVAQQLFQPRVVDEQEEEVLGAEGAATIRRH